MLPIKKYSTLFATKLNYILDLQNAPPLRLGRVKVIEEITKEKEQNILNWVFSGNLPKNSKKLMIADSLGVSYNYLFNDKVEVEDISKPEIHFENTYLIPFIPEDEIFNFKNQLIYPIKSRLPEMFPELTELVNKYGSQLYVTSLEKIDTEPFLNKGVKVIYSEKILLEESNLVVEKDKDKFIIKRIIKDGNSFFLEYLDKTKNLLQKTLINDYQYKELLLIILSYRKIFSSENK